MSNIKKNRAITLLGSNSGRNAGDAAILSSTLEWFSRLIPDLTFYVPTTHPKFILENYAHKYNVIPVNVMPWTGSIRLFGLPTLNCLRKSKIAVICDGIIFDKKLFNPLFNFLITLVLLVPFCKIFRCKLICLNTGIGPFNTKLGRVFARYVIDNCDFISMREMGSVELCREIGVKEEIFLTGDSAFVNPVSNEERAVEIMQNLGISTDQGVSYVGVNVTRYIDQWLEKNRKVGDYNKFKEILYRGLKQAKESLNIRYIFFSTQPMDLDFNRELADRLDGALISNTSILSHDIMAIMKRCDLLVGMRFHSLILASAVGVPIVGLVYALKVRNYMKDLESSQYGLELSEITEEKLSTALIRAYTARDMLRATQQKRVERFKKGAIDAFKLVADRYFSVHPARYDKNREMKTVMQNSKVS